LYVKTAQKPGNYFAKSPLPDPNLASLVAGLVAVPALVELLDDKDTEVRILAASSLGNIGHDAKTAIPVLTKMLRDKDVFVRSNAAWALGKVGPEARQALPALSELLHDKDDVVRRAAIEALSKIEKK
jgi:HEAT repeat protein